MLTTIIFGAALAFSIFFLIRVIKVVQNKDNIEDDIVSPIFAGISIFLWSYLYYLSH